jgi:hypothetical protein
VWRGCESFDCTSSCLPSQFIDWLECLTLYPAEKIVLILYSPVLSDTSAQSLS